MLRSLNRMRGLNHDRRVLRNHGLQRPVSGSAVSSDLSTWSPQNGGWSSNQTAAPDGSTTAGMYTENSSVGVQHRIDGTSTLAAGAATFSVYAKSAGRTVIWLRMGTTFTYAFDLSSGIVQAGTSSASANWARITPMRNGWFLCELNQTAAGNDTLRINTATSFDVNASNATYTGDGASGVYLWQPAAA